MRNDELFTLHNDKDDDDDDSNILFLLENDDDKAHRGRGNTQWGKQQQQSAMRYSLTAQQCSAVDSHQLLLAVNSPCTVTTMATAW